MPLQLRTLGFPDLRDTDGRRLEAVLRRPKLFALLAYLGLPEPGARHGRARVASLFWPDRAGAAARHCLRQYLYLLRQVADEPEIVTRGGHGVALRAGTIRCDAAAFREAATQGSPADALALYRGTFLDGLTVSGSWPFEQWVEERRRAFRAAAAESAWTLAERAARDGEVETVEGYVRRAIELAPYDEPRLRLGMDLLARVGHRSAGLRIGRSFVARLRRDLAVEPSSETREALVRLREGG